MRYTVVDLPFPRTIARSSSQLNLEKEFKLKCTPDPPEFVSSFSFQSKSLVKWRVLVLSLVFGPSHRRWRGKTELTLWRGQCGLTGVFVLEWGGGEILIKGVIEMEIALCKLNEGFEKGSDAEWEGERNGYWKNSMRSKELVVPAKCCVWAPTWVKQETKRQDCLSTWW
jgi:hypothetical protein